ncbi:MAG: hypothetical protein CO189_01070 [candidate division Zixibacteria bacterium CG_4_9_14_3_um_filter_46_8]|nr:MAG: hypothetical protein CO189_01070 [candidate division Zixibacteria bacterium CG_4_9_14_3_um_filter_46_8]
MANEGASPPTGSLVGGINFTDCGIRRGSELPDICIVALCFPVGRPRGLIQNLQYLPVIVEIPADVEHLAGQVVPISFFGLAFIKYLNANPIW